MRITPQIKLYGIPNSDAGYALAYIDGNSPHITRQWSYGISHPNKNLYSFCIKKIKLVALKK